VVLGRRPPTPLCEDALVPGVRHGGIRSITLLGEPRDVHVARAFVGRCLTEHDIEAAYLDCQTVVSELVTNALVHGRGPIVVNVDVQDSEIVLSVSDTHPSTPLQRAAADDDETGRGLAIVDALTVEWGVSVGERGKTTYARVQSDRPMMHPGRMASASETMLDAER
jgi:anti-sigma regulatory factor (Ser/Thr protein kinase)